ncbi:MAG TPA: 50S ribosomal protein L25 [Candidatus Paceibacterota bacterium]|jgi:large subunit ribosomal protein L25
MTITISATKREEIGRASHKLLLEDRMPAVVYGPKHEAEAISVPLHAFKKVLRDAGESTVIELTGLGQPLQVLIHEVYRDPVTTMPRHADLYAIEKGAKVEVSIPLSFVGESQAVKLGANIVKVMHELPIEADAANLPHEIEVDITSLAAIGDQIHVKDLKLPKGVTATVEGDELVALAQEVEVETEEDTTGEPNMDAIEVEKKGKDEEGESSEG